ncbi:MAG: glycosyltransferase [Selenomonadaceae bacterium]|nr:glycosyltransferase [Selenomonadaceae bacterium]
MSKIAILIPCYNESQTIAKVVRDYRQALPDAEIYVYDNNSSDGTDEIAREAGAIVRYEYRQGKGNVIRTMFRDIDADCYLMIDGDDTYPAEHAREMCDLILSGAADMVIGDRLSSTYFTENKRPFHNVGNVMVRKFINMFWRPKNPILDVMTGYRAFSPLFVKSFPVLSKGFEIETEMTIHALDKNFLLRSIPVNYRDRPAGSESKLNTYVDGAKVIMTIFNLYRDYKPLQFFGVLALILALIALILFLPVFFQYLETSLVPRFPTLIVSGFLMLASLLSFACGLILDTIAKNNRKTFELHMNLIKNKLR